MDDMEIDKTEDWLCDMFILTLHHLLFINPILHIHPVPLW